MQRGASRYGFTSPGAAREKDDAVPMDVEPQTTKPALVSCCGGQGAGRPAPGLPRPVGVDRVDWVRDSPPVAAGQAGARRTRAQASEPTHEADHQGIQPP